MLPDLGINVAVKTQKYSDNYQNIPRDIRIMLAVLRFKNGRFCQFSLIMPKIMLAQFIKAYTTLRALASRASAEIK